LGSCSPTWTAATRLAGTRPRLDAQAISAPSTSSTPATRTPALAPYTPATIPQTSAPTGLPSPHDSIRPVVLTRPCISSGVSSCRKLITFMAETMSPMPNRKTTTRATRQSCIRENTTSSTAIALIATSMTRAGA